MEKNTARGERERGIEKEREGEREREKGAARLVLSVGTQRYCSFSCRILERRRAIPQKGGRHHTLPQHVRTQRYLTVSCVDFLLNGIPMFDKKFVFSLIYSVPNRSLYRPPLTYLEPAAPPHWVNVINWAPKVFGLLPHATTAPLLWLFKRGSIWPISYYIALDSLDWWYSLTNSKVVPRQ